MNENELRGYIINKVKATISKHKMINPGDSIVLGLSGGPDSVCLTHILSQLKDELKIANLIAVHINHSLRGDEGDGDEIYAKEFSENCKVDFKSFRVEVNKYAKENKISTEQAGRRLRYEIFEKVRKEVGANQVAIAHNMNDQAETVLMRIMRGTGIKGLSGIAYKRPIGTDYLKDVATDNESGILYTVETKGMVIRPILDLERSEVEAYCRICKLKPHIDHTNLMPIYRRNKLRLELFPMIEMEFNPEVKRALARLSNAAKEDDSYIYQEARKIFDEKWDDAEKTLKIDGFKELHPSLAKRILFLCTGSAGLPINVDASHVEHVMSMVHVGEEAKEVDLTEGFYVRLSYGKLWFLNRNNSEDIIDPPIEFPFNQLDSFGNKTLELGNRTIVMELFESSELEKDNNTNILKLDYDLLHNYSSVVIRNRKAGDRIRVRGLGGTKKLQDFMTDRKIPRHEREAIALIVADGNVISVGIEAAQDCQVTDETKNILTVRFE